MKKSAGQRIVIAYFAVWIASTILFWLFFRKAGGIEAFVLLFVHIILPFATLILSLLMGLKNVKWKWIWSLVFGLMGPLLICATFSLELFLTTGQHNLPGLTFAIVYLGNSLLGTAVGQLIFFWRNRRK